jgi:outer membrane protein OmpA-like peptidoglycan-associated protein/uncharacterized protein YidB (DUF937 family)
MGTYASILAEAGNQFGLSSSKATSLFSGLMSLINETPGGLSAILDRLRKSGLGETVSTWLTGGTAPPVSGSILESVFGHDPIDRIASKTGLSFSTAASALGFMLPGIVQRLTPGGVVPMKLPSDALAFASSATSTVAAGARQAAYATESAVKQSHAPRWLWPVLALLGVFLLGYWLWPSHRTADNAVFNLEQQVRLAGQKAAAALGALKPGFTAQDLVSAVNLNVINFASGSAQIPADQTDFLNKVALAIKSAPAGTVLEIDGYTDNTGDPAANLQLSQQRADAIRLYLVQQGVNPNALLGKGYGDTQPIATNATEEGKFRNRRIEFTVK